MLGLCVTGIVLLLLAAVSRRMARRRTRGSCGCYCGSCAIDCAERL